MLEEHAICLQKVNSVTPVVDERDIRIPDDYYYYYYYQLGKMNYR